MTVMFDENDKPLTDFSFMTLNDAFDSALELLSQTALECNFRSADASRSRECRAEDNAFFLRYKQSGKLLRQHKQDFDKK